MNSYCMKCKRMVEIKGAKKTKVKGRELLRGKCVHCNTNTAKFI